MEIDAAARRRVTRDDAPVIGCPVCAATGGGWTPWRELARPAARRAAVEAVVDHLGFCTRHIAWLSAGGWPSGLADVLAEAYGALAAMLGDRNRYEGRLLEIMFRSRCSCVACTLERRRIAIAAPAPPAERLCLPHYLAATGKADEGELARLATAARRRAAALLQQLDGASGDAGSALEAALNWLGGSIRGTFDGSASVTTSSPASECAVCRAARSALDRWVYALGRAARVGVGLHGLLPLCDAHIGMCVDRGALPAADLAREVIGTVASALHAGLAENERAERHERDAAGSVFHRPCSSAYILGRRRRTLRLARCAACERVELACERARGEILEHLSGRGKRAESAGRDLCVRHFAAVYVLAPRGETRPELAKGKRAALESARAALLRREWRDAIAQLGGAYG